MARMHPLERFEAILVVGIGGFAGSNLRHFVEQLVPSSMVATATVNVLGSFLLGVLLYEEIFADSVSQRGRTILGTGFLASFTTFSTFVVDALRASPLVGIGYVFGSYALGFGAVLLGRAVARWATGATAEGRGVGE
ncbi:MAG: CrcB family protein [Halanaeroarchaeum sp.]